MNPRDDSEDTSTRKRKTLRAVAPRSRARTSPPVEDSLTMRPLSSFKRTEDISSNEPNEETENDENEDVTASQLDAMRKRGVVRSSVVMHSPSTAAKKRRSDTLEMVSRIKRRQDAVLSEMTDLLAELEQLNLNRARSRE
jgi:hypothetical protein